MSHFQVHNLAKHMQVSESYLYTLVRRGTLKATSHNPVHIDQETVKDFYLKKIPTTLFNLTHAHKGEKNVKQENYKQN
tara:strand:- start:2495 stop:2728 length:234 start_codon:yes stop_codon:yes gene_type:complete